MSIKIGIIVASVREQRVGLDVAKWVLNQANSKNYQDVVFDLIDLKDYPLELYGTKLSKEGLEVKERWSKAITEHDGFIMVIPEYNHGVSGAFKNALDYLKPELDGKVVSYVGYGGVGAARSIEAARLIAVEQGMAIVKFSVNFLLAIDFVNYSQFSPLPHQEKATEPMLERLVKWTRLFKSVR